MTVNIEILYTVILLFKQTELKKTSGLRPVYHSSQLCWWVISKDFWNVDFKKKEKKKTEVSPFHNVVQTFPWKLSWRYSEPMVNVEAWGHCSFKRCLKDPDFPSEHFINAALKLHGEHGLLEVQNAFRLNRRGIKWLIVSSVSGQREWDQTTN